MKRASVLLTVFAVWATFGTAAEESRAKVVARADAAQKVLQEFMGAPDKSIPQDVASGAECLAIIPSMLKASFIFGANYGKGVATCRTTDDNWTAPAPVRLTGGSWGLQAGGQAVDLVMVIMNKQGMQNLLNSKFKIGADASAAVGPIGRQAAGSTDWKMRAQVLTYSRARGIFAGISLDGAVLKQDTADTIALYGKNVGFRNILTGKVPPPEGTKPFLDEVAQYFAVSRGAATERKQAEAAATYGGTTAAATGAAPSQQPSKAEAAGNIAANTPGGASTAGGVTTEKLSPAQTQSRILSSLSSASGLSASDVVVNVTTDTVQLVGSVPSDQDKATVVRIAKENAGGRNVDDSQLAVKQQ